MHKKLCFLYFHLFICSILLVANIPKAPTQKGKDLLGYRATQNFIEHEFKRAEKWPRRSGIPGAVPIEVVTEDRESKKYIYRSKNFEFNAPTKLARSDVRQFARVFEATLQAAQELPHPWEIVKKDGFFKIVLFESDESYYEAGGVYGSGGIFQPGTNSILVPYRSLGLEKKSSSYSVRGEPRLEVLIHEVFHQVTLGAEWSYQMGVFFIEGAAQLLDSTPYEKGVFDWSRFSPESLDEKYRGFITIRPLDEMIFISSRDWIRAFYDYDPSINYRSALIYYYYFTFMVDDQVGGVTFDLIAAVRAGNTIKGAVNEYLLAGKSFEQIEEEIVEAFSRDKVKLRIVGE